MQQHTPVKWAKSNETINACAHERFPCSKDDLGGRARNTQPRMTHLSDGCAPTNQTPPPRRRPCRLAHGTPHPWRAHSQHDFVRRPRAAAAADDDQRAGDDGGGGGQPQRYNAAVMWCHQPPHLHQSTLVNVSLDTPPHPSGPPRSPIPHATGTLAHRLRKVPPAQVPPWPTG